MAYSDSKDSNLLVQFKIDKIFLEARTRKAKELYLTSEGKQGEDRPLYEDREFIEIRSPGSQDTVYREVSENDKVRFAEQYARFKANARQQFVGTPLTEWPAVTPANVKNLQFFNIYTVEHLADAPDVQIQKIGMDGAELRKRAQIYLMKAKGDDPEKVAMRLQMEEQAKQLADMQEQIKSFMAGSPSPAVPIKKRGGRPTKEEAEAKKAAQVRSMANPQPNVAVA